MIGKKTVILFAAIFCLICNCVVAEDTSIMAGDMLITSKLMTFFKNIYVARGGVKAENKDSVMTADRGIYDRDLEIVKAIDNVKVTQPGSVLSSDYLEAYVKEDRILARGNPKLVRIMDRVRTNSETGKSESKKSRIILTCNEVEAFQKENRFLAKGNVRLIEVDFRAGETEEEAAENEKKPASDLRCEILEMFSGEDKAIARNNVEILTDTLRATGDKAIYLNAENRMIIVGHAHAFQTTKDQSGEGKQVSELFANKIIYYPNEERSIAVGNVHATVYPGGDNGKKDKAPRDKKKKQDESDSDSENEDEAAEDESEETEPEDDSEDEDSDSQDSDEDYEDENE